MPASKYLLIGGGVAAHRAAQQIREQDAEGVITLVSDEPHVPYDRPPLSKEFLRGEKPRDELFFDAPDALRGQRVNLLLDTRVAALEAGRNIARLANGDELEFDKALIATGGRPVRLDLPGADLDGIHYLRTLDDSAALRAAAAGAERAAIVGAGFIGIEAAASLTQLGLAVTVLEAAPRIWARFADETLAEFVRRHCEERGVGFRTGVTVTGFAGDGRVRAVRTTGGDVACDLVLVAVGIRPNVALAADAGLEVDDGILVDDRMRTSHPDVYAAGDVANYPDPYFGRRRRVEHWGHAEYCGQVAGRAMAGGDLTYGLLTYVWSDIFDLHLEFAGDETAHDRALVRGRMDDGRFTVLFLRHDRLTAYFAVNGAPQEFARLQKLIKQGADLAGRDGALRDPDFDLRSLLR